MDNILYFMKTFFHQTTLKIVPVGMIHHKPTFQAKVPPKAWPQANNNPVPKPLITQFANKYRQTTDN